MHLRETVINRRNVSTGIDGSAILSNKVITAAVSGSYQLFVNTPFANNRIAILFQRGSLRLPNAGMISGSGPMSFGCVAGGARLLTLWSERCAPCLFEARVLADARPRVAGDGFDIISLLAGSVAKLGHAGAAARLVKAGAPGLPLFIEPNSDCVVADALAADPARLPVARSALPPAGKVPKASGYSLPCTVLVDRRDHVRGRAFGISVVRSAPRSPGAGPAVGPGPLSVTLPVSRTTGNR